MLYEWVALVPGSVNAFNSPGYNGAIDLATTEDGLTPLLNKAVELYVVEARMTRIEADHKQWMKEWCEHFNPDHAAFCLTCSMLPYQLEALDQGTLSPLDKILVKELQRDTLHILQSINYPPSPSIDMSRGYSTGFYTTPPPLQPALYSTNYLTRDR